MLIAAIICFALAALGGVVLALGHRGKDKPPMALALGHGALAASGLVLLVLAYLARASAGSAMGTTGSISLGAFGVAALGGFYLFSRRFVDKPTPMSVILIHAGVAVAGFVLLLIVAFG